MNNITPKDYNASGSGQTTTGTISSGTSSLSITQSIDFVNGQGIRINHAGAAFAINQSSSLTVTPQGATGATNRAYTIASLNATGGVGRSITNVTISNSNATLSATNFNRLSWVAPTGTAPTAYAVYGNTTGAMALIGIVAVGTTTFDDIGSGAINCPDWIPSAPQTAASLNDWLVTTITSGAGSTTLILSASASATATSQVVAHDDTAAIQSAIYHAQYTGDSVYLPSGTYPISSSLIISSRIKFYGSGYQSDAVAVYNASNISQSSGFLASVIVPLPSVNGIVATTNHAVSLNGFQVIYPTGPIPFPNTTGITIQSDSGSTNANVNSVLRDIVTLGAYYGISFINCLDFVIDNCNSLQSWGGGISLNGSNFPSYGDSTICNSTVWGNGVTSYSYHIALGAGGGLRVVNNKLNFGNGVITSGILINPNLVIAQSVEPLIISNNSIEGCAVGINFANANLTNGIISQVVISANQIWTGVQAILVNTGGSTQWIGGMSITGNCLMVNGGSNKTCVIIDNAFIGTIAGNTFCLSGGGTTSTGIILNSHSSLFTIGVNAFDSGYTTQVNDLGSNNTIVSGGGTSLPSQTGNNGKFLTTDGSNPSWALTPQEVATQTGNSGKFLTTNGTATSWDTPSGTLPSQTGNTGKFLKTDGSTASWDIPAGGGYSVFMVRGLASQNTTSYFTTTVAPTSTESDVPCPMPRSGIFNGLYVKTQNNVGGSGQTSTYTLRINGSDTALTCSISSGSASGSDSTHTASYSAGDKLTIKVVNSATTSSVSPSISISST